jgi:hypothetical protein
MIQRFQIEDLISQDLTGVVFRALDTETGMPVALRRLFPFGAAGGGLNADEQNAYTNAMNGLVGVSHPALRSVICGGCDPVDGIPYIATEWIDGDSLGSYIEHGPLSAEVASEVITRALEVSELLSHALAEEDVWVDTHLQSIIAGNDQSGRGFTFWIRPLKCQGRLHEAGSLEPIISLTEEVMGWQGLVIDDQSGHGLAAWLMWLRQFEGSISLREVRIKLAAMVAAQSHPVKRPVRQGTRPPPRVIARPSSKAPWIINIGLAVITLGLGGWLLIRQQGQESSRSWQNAEQAVAITPKPMPESADSVQLQPAQEAAVHSAESNEAADEAEAKEVVEATTPPVKNSDASVTAEATRLAEAAIPPEKSSDAAAPPVEVIPWTERERLIEAEGKQVIVEGRFEGTTFSKKRRVQTMYLLFSQIPDDSDTCGAVMNINSAPKDLSEAALQSLRGKKIRIHGIVQPGVNSGVERAVILIKDRASIEPME